MTHTIVLLPGLDGTGVLFSEFAAALKDTVEPKIVSYPTHTPLGYPALLNFVQKALPTNKPYTILGESFSGPIAISLASIHPPHLKGIVLSCSFVRNPHPVGRHLKGLIDRLPSALFHQPLLRYVLMGRFRSRELSSRLAEATAAVSDTVLRARLKAVVNIDVSDQLRETTVPLLYLRATQDRVVPASAARLIKSLKPEAEIVEINAPHFLLQTAPKDAADHVTRFIEKCGC